MLYFDQGLSRTLTGEFGVFLACIHVGCPDSAPDLCHPIFPLLHFGAPQDLPRHRTPSTVAISVRFSICVHCLTHAVRHLTRFADLQSPHRDWCSSLRVPRQQDMAHHMELSFSFCVPTRAPSWSEECHHVGQCTSLASHAGDHKRFVS